MDEQHVDRVLVVLNIMEGHCLHSIVTAIDIVQVKTDAVTVSLLAIVGGASLLSIDILLLSIHVQVQWSLSRSWSDATPLVRVWVTEVPAWRAHSLCTVLC